MENEQGLKVGDRVIVDKARIVPVSAYDSLLDDAGELFVAFDNDGIVATLEGRNKDIPIPRESFVLLSWGIPSDRRSVLTGGDMSINVDEDFHSCIVLTDQSKGAICEVLTVGSGRDMYLIGKKVLIREKVGFLLNLPSDKYRITWAESLLAIVED